MSTPPPINDISSVTLGMIIQWVRRIIKTSSTQSISDSTIVDYINRFYLYDMPARVQLFELKRQYTFDTIPNQFTYQFPFAPFVDDTDENNPIARQGYQIIRTPVYCDGVQIGFYTSNQAFYNIFPEFVNNEFIATGDGTPLIGDLQISQTPILRSYRDVLGILTPYVIFTASTGSGDLLYVVDNGDGILIQTDASFQQIINGAAGAINYTTGAVTALTFFPDSVPAGNIVEVQTSPFSAGVPRLMLFFNNIIKLFPVPDRAYKIQMDVQITPAQFISAADTDIGSVSFEFDYMAEYLARGAAQKILSDSGDYEQYAFYEKLFKDQENQVLRRTSRQMQVTRTPTIYSAQTGQTSSFYTQY